GEPEDRFDVPRRPWHRMKARVEEALLRLPVAPDVDPERVLVEPQGLAGLRGALERGQDLGAGPDFAVAAADHLESTIELVESLIGEFAPKVGHDPGRDERRCGVEHREDSLARAPARDDPRRALDHRPKEPTLRLREGVRFRGANVGDPQNFAVDDER